MRDYHLFTILNIQISLFLLEDFSFNKADGGAYIHSKPFYCKDVYKMQCRNSMTFGEDYKFSLWVLLRDKQYSYICFTPVAVDVKLTCQRGQEIFMSALILLLC